MNLYTLTKIRSTYIDEIDATFHELCHDKSGATIYFLQRDDENKTFAIGFKTIPTDDTGVFHILEHSVLCGSEKFPLKDPFAELIRGSVSTYLNALTYGDKTVYPVSSKNGKAFLGLVDVYLDAVLHPNALTNPHIFMQEGYHYEIGEDGKLNINGVVYNEMKGAYSSVDDFADYHINRLLAPGSTCSYDSGGHPDFIPELTFDEFKKTHEKFYHPSNSCIFLDGSINTDEIFPLICEYLDEYVKSDVTISSDLGESTVTEPLTITYPADDGQDKTRIYLSHNTFSHTEREKNIALSLAAGSIADSNNAPLTKRILASGLCESFNFYSTRSYDVNALNVSFVGVKTGKEQELIEIYLKELEAVIAEGLPKENLRASIDRLEFSTREADYGSYPKGIVYMTSVMEWHFHGENPEESLKCEELLAFLRKMVEGDYYDNLLKTAVSSPQATLILHPDEKFSEKKEAELRKALDEKYSAMSEEEKSELKRLADSLVRWQETPDTDEALATIPSLKIEDLKTEPKKTPIEIECFSGVEIILHPIHTSGISYPEVFFDASDIPAEDIPYVRLFCDMMCEWNTELGDVTYFRNRVKQHMGMFYTAATTAKRKDDVKLYITFRMSCLEKEKDNAEVLFSENLYYTLFDNKAVLIQNVKQMYTASLEHAVTRGESLAMIRDAAKHSLYEALTEKLYGYSYHVFIKELAERIEDDADAVLKKLELIREKYLCRERMTLGITEPDGLNFAKRLILTVREGGAPAEKSELRMLPKINEGVAIPAQTSYTARTSNLYEIGDNLYTGAFATLTNIMSYEILWNEIRVKGGAYDTGFVARSNSGTLGCYSYRDPSASQSLKTFGDIGRLLCEFLDTSPDLIKYIIGTVGAADTVTTPRSEGAASTALHLAAKSHEDVARIRKESVEVTLEELYRLASIVTKAMESSTFTAVASREELEKNPNLQEILEL